jgi:hypothetical protein
MLLTITTTHSPATDLGYLLHKNPARPQRFELAFGNVHVLYPEANENRCTAALLLDIDPVGLVRNRRGPAGEGFALLASENAVHTQRDHRWHMTTLARLATPDGPIAGTEHLTVDLNDEASIAAGIRWWEDLTARGGEGMVVKPLEFIVRGRRGLVQPALKCRGREYLRIIYGPEYTAPEHLQRLRSRGLGAKRSLALREFALGIEALERFVRREPLRRVHECVFGVLALESEPVDPRL